MLKDSELVPVFLRKGTEKRHFPGASLPSQETGEGRYSGELFLNWRN